MKISSDEIHLMRISHLMDNSVIKHLNYKGANKLQLKASWMHSRHHAWCLRGLFSELTFVVV